MSVRFWVTVLASESLAPGTMTTIEHGDRRIAIFNVAGELYATEDVKLQAFVYLTDGRIEGDVVVCPLDHGRFHIRSGRKLSPSAVDELKTYPVRVVDGNVEIELSSEP